VKSLALACGLIVLPALAAASEARCRWGELAPYDAPATAGPAAPTAIGDYSLAVIYAVPANVPPNPAVVARIKQATRDILTWYQAATGGRTWTLAFPETVRTYNAQQTREYYRDNGDWWGSLVPEMGNAGQPVWGIRTVTAIWAHGAGWWAGAAQGCVTDCGVALFGVELFPEFNNAAYSGGSCPGGTGVAAWPCTPEGAYAHELGHTLGLPHPADVPATQADANHSIMQTHWNYPTYATGAEAPWGFLTVERQALHSSAFMKAGVTSIVQTYDPPIVNLPSTGAPPTASFTTAGTGSARTLAFTNTSAGAAESYWTYGDGAVSTANSPTHTYPANGPFSPKLRSYASNGMMAMQGASTVVDVPVSRATAAPLRLGISGANPFAHTTSFILALPQAGRVRMTVMSADGRRVATLMDSWRPAGTWRAAWNGCDDTGRRAPAGLYLARAVSMSGMASVRIVKVE
jgi:hypothetical protein